jgi:hypothetical protein
VAIGITRTGEPVYANLEFLDGTRGAHLSISGVSGVATKTSYATFLLYSLFHSDALGAEAANTKAIIFNVSETPGQAFKVQYRLSCFDRHGEAHFGRGQFGGSGPYRKVESIPARFKAQKCYVDGAGSLNDNSGGMKITVKARI